MERLYNGIYWLGARLWLIPAIISGAAFIVASLLVFSDVRLVTSASEVKWLYSGDAGTARDLLSTILSGMINMASLLVSITIVVLSLAAGQLGPRIIWNFIGDRSIQAVIGLFFGTILYTLVVLRSINGELGAGEVPHFAVTIASILVVVSLFALLAFISKLARSIVSDNVVDEIATSLEKTIGRLPARGEPIDGDDGAGEPYPHTGTISLGQNGYVQVIDYDRLCELAAAHDALLHVNVRAGDFVLGDREHVQVFSRRPVDDDLRASIREAIVVGSERTPTQDIEYAVRQLVEIALRALSPSLNDPYTAIAVIDRLAVAIEFTWGREFPAKRRYDENGSLRVVARVSDYKGIVDAAFNQIRQAAAQKPAVLIELAKRLHDLAQTAQQQEQREAVLRQARMLDRAAAEIGEPEDRRDLQEVVRMILGEKREARSGAA